ncbi:putative protein, partial [Arabidopsis thaliana]
NAFEKLSIDPIRLLAIFEKSETEQQSQLLTDPEEEGDVSTVVAEKTKRDGKESITASLGRDHERDDDSEAEDDHVEGCDEEEKESDGVGYISIPRSLPIVANRYVSEINSRVGTKYSNGNLPDTGFSVFINVVCIAGIMSEIESLVEKKRSSKL